MRKVPGGPSPEMINLALKNLRSFLKTEDEYLDTKNI
jgi:hypothetical protein